MRKTTIAAFVILLGGFGALLWMLNFYTRQVRQEIAASGDWTKELRAAGSLAPDTMVKLRRGPSGPDDPVPDKGTYGLVVEVDRRERRLDEGAACRGIPGPRHDGEAAAGPERARRPRAGQGHVRPRRRGRSPRAATGRRSCVPRDPWPPTRW